jgi:hypothetical protein
MCIAGRISVSQRKLPAQFDKQFCVRLEHAWPIGGRDDKPEVGKLVALPIPYKRQK